MMTEQTNWAGLFGIDPTFTAPRTKRCPETQAEEMDRPINWERISLAAFAAAGWTATFVLVLTR
jgi:hypothetical protein